MARPAPQPDRDPDAARLDRWLWAARFFKTRALAAEAIDGGKVEVNGDRAKRARALRPGDEVRVRIPPYEWIVDVRQLATRRGPAAEAALLYEERPTSLEARTRLREQVRAMPAPDRAVRGRPTKKDRRDLEKWRRP